LNEWLLVAVGLVLTIGTGLFVASEFALVNLDRHDLEQRQEGGEKGLGTTIKALRITSTHLSSAQLGITLTTLLTGYAFEPAISSLLESPLTTLGMPQRAVTAFGALIGLLLATLFSMVIGELVPKNFALALPVATAKVVVPFQAGFTAVFKPIVLLLNNTANGLIRLLGIEPKEELSGARTADELIYLVRHSASSGLLDEDDARLLDRSLSFATRDASVVMTPRISMSSVHANDTAAQVIAASAASGNSRLAVLDHGPDDIVGLVHVKHAFAVRFLDRGTTTATDLMVEAPRVPETLNASALLDRLRGDGLQMAVVVDEYGGTAGVVTLEDLVEELIGELEDEHDRHHSTLTRRGRSLTFDATWRPDELRRRTGVIVPEGEHWDTVAGYLSAQLGRIPEAGDIVPIAGGNLRVDRAEGPRVSRVQFIPHDPAAEGSGTTVAQPQAPRNRA
jgi:CBS domain containing-hemolysin-like protein